MALKMGSRWLLVVSLLGALCGVAVGEAIERMSAPQIEDELQVSGTSAVVSQWSVGMLAHSSYSI